MNILHQFINTIIAKNEIRGRKKAEEVKKSDDTASITKINTDINSNNDSKTIIETQKFEFNSILLHHLPPTSNDIKVTTINIGGNSIDIINISQYAENTDNKPILSDEKPNIIHPDLSNVLNKYQTMFNIVNQQEALSVLLQKIMKNHSDLKINIEYNGKKLSNSAKDLHKMMIEIKGLIKNDSQVNIPLKNLINGGSIQEIQDLISKEIIEQSKITNNIKTSTTVNPVYISIITSTIQLNSNNITDNNISNELVLSNKGLFGMAKDENEDKNKYIKSHQLLTDCMISFNCEDKQTTKLIENAENNKLVFPFIPNILADQILAKSNVEYLPSNFKNVIFTLLRMNLFNNSDEIIAVFNAVMKELDPKKDSKILIKLNNKRMENSDQNDQFLYLLFTFKANENYELTTSTLNSILSIKNTIDDLKIDFDKLKISIENGILSDIESNQFSQYINFIILNELSQDSTQFNVLDVIKKNSFILEK